MRAVYLRAARAAVRFLKKWEGVVANGAHPGNRVYAMREFARLLPIARFAAARAGVRIAYLEE